MHLRENEQARWNAMTADAQALERQDPHLKIKIEFRMSDPAIKKWMTDVLAPSLMDGEAGVTACLNSIEEEKDTVVRALKISILQHWWTIFDTKTPADVVSHFKNHGVEKDTLQHMVIDSHFPPETTADQIEQIRQAIAEQNGVDPEDIIVEFDGDDVPTRH